MTIDLGFSDTKTIYFKGIPYAQPPIGNLRFQKPKPIENQQLKVERRNASDYGPICMQDPQYFTIPGLVIDEDCLYLNVFMVLYIMCTLTLHNRLHVFLSAVSTSWRSRSLTGTNVAQECKYQS